VVRRHEHRGLGLTLDQLGDTAARGKCKLYGVRSKRVWPGRDEKMLAGWNGWMLAAFAEASLAFDKEAYRDIVRRNADFLLTRIDADGRLTRHAKIPGLLEDYAGVAWGLTLAYETTGERRYLDGAKSLADAILERFRDEENGGFYDTPTDHEKLITLPKDLFEKVARLHLERIGDVRVSQPCRAQLGTRHDRVQFRDLCRPRVDDTIWVDLVPQLPRHQRGSVVERLRPRVVV
jgi:uncharacterized protein YyaL (SSP411 family)